MDGRGVIERADCWVEKQTDTHRKKALANFFFFYFDTTNKKNLEKRITKHKEQ